MFHSPLFFSSSLLPFFPSLLISCSLLHGFGHTCLERIKLLLTHILGDVIICLENTLAVGSTELQTLGAGLHKASRWSNFGHCSS